MLTYRNFYIKFIGIERDKKNMICPCLVELRYKILFFLYDFKKVDIAESFAH